MAVTYEKNKYFGKRKALVFAGLMVSMFCCSMVDSGQVWAKARTCEDFVHGSAESLEGTSVVVTIFANDANYQWDPDSGSDYLKRRKVRRYLKIAGDYLEENAAEYQKKAKFITDFSVHTDLAYYADFDEDLEIEDAANDEAAWEYIEENIDVDAILEKYQADNILFFIVLNTDEYSDGITCTRDWYEGMPYPYEVVFLYYMDEGETCCPAIYAHEMLHTFGVPDYYQTDEWFHIEEDFLDYVEEEIPNDIMYTCSDPVTWEYDYNAVLNDMSELTAYYAGLTDKSEAAEKFGLTGYQHSSLKNTAFP